jgi:hypothetical protein
MAGSIPAGCVVEIGAGTGQNFLKDQTAKPATITTATGNPKTSQRAGLGRPLGLSRVRRLRLRMAFDFI